MTENTIIRLLIIDHLDSISEQLRDAGFTVQAERVQQATDIEAYLKNKTPDLVACGIQAELPNIASIHTQLAATALNIPIIALLPEDQQSTTFSLLQAGASSACDPANSKHLLAVFKKEIELCQLRHQAAAIGEQVTSAEARSKAILESSPQAIAYIHEGTHMYANNSYSQLFGYDNSDDLAGVTLMDLVATADRDGLKRYLRDSTKAGKELEPIDIQGLTLNGTEIPLAMRCVPTRIDDEPCLQIVFTEAGAAPTDSATNSHVDSLTQLCNRPYFVQQLDAQLAQEVNQRDAVLYILLEAYRPLINRFGLPAGEILVAEIAQKLTSMVGANDILARFSDAVFTFYRPKASEKALFEFGKEICATIKGHACYLHDSLLTTNASIGICFAGELNDNAKTSNYRVLEWLSLADKACEDARKQGGNRPALFKSAQARNAKTELNEADAVDLIREAISVERMQLFYQPIVSFAGDTDERYETKLKIFDEDRQPLDMDKLLPLAENSNLLLSLDKWIIVAALATVTERYNEDQSLANLFIQLSSDAIKDSEFIGWLQQRLKDTGLPSHILIIQITEDQAEKYFKEIKPFRDKLREIGCSFALSEFGGKANSERILNHVSPDYLKLNSTLIEKVANAKNDSDRQSMTDLTQQAQAMHAQVVVSGITNANQMASIWQFGVTLVQGDMVKEPANEMRFDFAEFAG